MADLNAQLILSHLYDIRYEYLNDNYVDNDSYLLELVSETLKIWPDPKLERKWRDYEEYYEEVGSDSMLFSELLDLVIEYVEPKAKEFF